MNTPGLPRLDTYTLRLFIAVAREGSIARAAQREHLAASALSRRLADLERALKVPLLVRSARGVGLTEAGQYLFDRGHRIEQELASLVQDMWAVSGAVTGSVRLFANPSAVVGFLPERLRAFCDRYPEVAVELGEHRSREVLRACLDDRADVGVAVAQDAVAGLDSWHFADDPLIVLMPAGHALAKAARLKFRDVLGHGLVTIQSGGSLDQLLREQAQSARAALQPRVSVESFDAACRMVEAGLGVAIVPTSAAAAFAGSARFERRPLDEAWAPRELRLYALRKQPRSRAVEALIELLQPGA
ncbi:LysR family transcriptional regulator [Ramlibacter sp. MAHUQ-53]|uniref:LysR family transcriptional regulator n=1 Tax=unclassified Ramlibacter TaxID=2617605 RepID=UPI00363755FD